MSNCSTASTGKSLEGVQDMVAEFQKERDAARHAEFYSVVRFSLWLFFLGFALLLVGFVVRGLLSKS